MNAEVSLKKELCPLKSSVHGSHSFNLFLFFEQEGTNLLLKIDSHL